MRPHADAAYKLVNYFEQFAEQAIEHEHEFEQMQAKRQAAQNSGNWTYFASIRAELAALQVEGDAIRARIYNGELTREALCRFGERVRPIEYQLERLATSDDFLVNSCTDVALNAERGGLTKQKKVLIQKHAEAKRRLADAIERIANDKRSAESIDVGFHSRDGTDKCDTRLLNVGDPVEGRLKILFRQRRIE